MSAKRVRHLPGLEGQKLVGFISIGDLVKFLVGDSLSYKTRMGRGRAQKTRRKACKIRAHPR